MLRSAARAGLAEHGLALAASGTWPTAVLGEQPVTPSEPLQAFAAYAGPSALRQHCSGLHVHVGVASPEECMWRLEAVLPWLPLVLALSANSPYAGGGETGLASTRAELLLLLPRAGAPPAFANYEDWEAFAERLVELGLADDLMRLWWDARPHPRLGTLEIRMPDQPTTLAATAGLAALAQALVAGAQSPPRRSRIAASTPRIAGRRRASAPPPAWCTPRPCSSARRTSSSPSSSAASSRWPGSSGARRSSASWTASTRRAPSSRRGGRRGSGACASGWSRSRTMGCDGQIGDDAGERRALRALRAATRRRAGQAQRDRVGEREPARRGDARLGTDEIVAALDRAGFRQVATVCRRKTRAAGPRCSPRECVRSRQLFVRRPRSLSRNDHRTPATSTIRPS